MFIDARTLSEDTVIEVKFASSVLGQQTTLAREFIGQDRVCLRVGLN